jgi:large subunit ribosomal protein L16
MKIPKKTKFRKAHRGTMKGISKGARELAFGTIGLQAVEPAWMSAQQIEAMRSTVSRHLKKKGRLYLRVFADKPVSKKPAETRMGKGKGAVEMWVSVVKRERILLELADLEDSVAKEILHTVSCKLPMKTRVVYSGNNAIEQKAEEV